MTSDDYYGSVPGEGKICMRTWDKNFNEFILTKKLMQKSEFLRNLDNFSNHRVLLWEALELLNAPGLVVEFGSGDGSTPYLKKYCQEFHLRPFRSYDSDKDWAAKTGSKFVENWNKIQIDWNGFSHIELLFLDHAPGERRQYDLVKYTNIARVIVIHDSEPTGGGDYRVRQHFGLFRWVVEVQSEGAWTSMMSNFVDLDGLVGKEWETEIGEVYRISEWQK